MTDRVRAFKMERPASGGTQTDENMTEVDIGQDYLDARGLTLQLANATAATADATVYVDRAPDSALQFTDQTSGTLKLAQLLTSALGKPGSHASTPDILHWVGAPGDGFPSGTFRQATMTGQLPLIVTWWTSSAMTQRLFQTTFSYQGVLVMGKTHTLYVAGAPVRTLTETFSYTASLFCPAVTRTWT